MKGTKRRRWPIVLVSVLVAIVLAPALALGASSGPEPIYQTLDELEGKRIAYVNGSVYNRSVQAKVEGTSEQFYASLADCVAAVEAGKADAAAQLSYCCELVVNRRGGTVALLPEHVQEVEEAFFFPHGDPLVAQFNEVIDRFTADGTIDALIEKWVGADESKKTLPEQTWDAPNGTLRFATSGVLEPYSYVGEGGQALGYDVDLALLIAKELGYHLDISTITMDAIFASVQTGKVDFGGTLTNTKERAEMVDFSKQVMPSYIAIIVPAKEGQASGATGETLEIDSLDKLDGKKIGVANGSTYDLLIEQNLPGTYQLSYFNSISDMVAALKSGKIDAFASDEPVARLAISQNDGIGLIDEPITKDNYGFFLKKGSPLTAQFNEVIQKLEADGTLDALKEKWEGADASAKTLPAQDWDTPNGTLKMVTSAQLEPCTYLSDGKIVGYDIEVALLICKELGYGLEVEEQDVAAMLAAVPAGKADFGGGAISITEERKEKMDFTIPDYHGALCVAVRTVASDTPALGGFAAGLKDSFRKTFLEEDRWELIVSGLGITVLISVCSGALGLLVGYATVLARRNNTKWLVKLVNGYQAIMGGVPLVVILMVLYYVVFGSINISGVLVAILAFALAFGSTAGSTMWTAVDGIDIIQEETGLALGYTRKQVFHKIIFPQARQQFTPQLIGQFVSLVKDTAIVGYIAVQDLTRASDLIRARTMDAFFPLISTAIIYFLFCRLLALILRKIAARLDTSDRPRKIEGVEG